MAFNTRCGAGSMNMNFSKTISLDLHSHTLEKRIPEKAYWRHAQGMGLNGIAITEHPQYNPKKAFERVKALQPKNITLIPGSELNTSIGHVLCYAPTPELYEVHELFEKPVEITHALQIARKEGFLLSIAHPWGFSYDSAAFLIGEKRLQRFVRENHVGVEAFNGMIGDVSEFLFKSKLIQRPLKFFNFLEKNAVSQRIGLARMGGVLYKHMDHRITDMAARLNKTFELARQANFITAGGDSHNPTRIGSGLLHVQWTDEEMTPENVLKALQERKRVAWAGPHVREISPRVFQRVQRPVQKKEIVESITYMVTTAIKRRKSLPIQELEPATA